jgi:hypothetical protein
MICDHVPTYIHMRELIVGCGQHNSTLNKSVGPQCKPTKLMRS